MRTKINAQFQSVQFSWIAGRMRAVALDKTRTKEDRLEEITELGATLISMAKINTEHWRSIVELLED